MIKLKSLLSIFALSFICCLLGWLFAVFVLPGQQLQHLAKIKQKEQALLTEKPKTQSQPFLEELKNNILLLFDPYKMDSLVKKETELDQKSSFIKKTDSSVKIKKDSSLPAVVSQKAKNKLIIEKQPKLIEEPPSPLKRPNPELKKIQDGYDKKNREQLLTIEKEQKFFKTNGKFSFMVNIFSNQEKAFKYINQMKKQYPLWSFLLKAHNNHIRIYLGPFPSKDLAKEFKKSLPIPLPFSSLEFLEEVSL